MSKILVPVTEVGTVLGMLTNLPCNMTPALPGDKVLLVLWYKDGYGKPLYSFDLRNIQGKADVIWASELRDRVNLNIKSDPTAFLTFMGVEEQDKGMYRCRVDFKKSPTRFRDVNLSITVPPKEVVFLDEKGTPVEDEVGPYMEGSTLVITCDVIGGWPASEVVWWRDEKRIDSSWEQISPGKSRNTLKIEPLRRSDLNAVLKCLGNNNNQTKPVFSSVKISMQLSPVSLDISADDSWLSVDQEYTWECSATGANPPPTLTWWNWLGQEVPSVQQNVEEGNRSVSTVYFTAAIKDEGKYLTCRADHPALKNKLEVMKIIKLKYKPKLFLRLGRKIEEQSIKEGDDVYMSCSVTANPPISHIVWTHNGKVVNGLEGSGYKINKENLIIRNISSDYIGKYSCEGTNSEGTGMSNVVFLSIAYLPRCRAEVEYRRVSRGESIKLQCPVDAVPPSVDYRWEFNSSNTIRPLHPDSSGIAVYTPFTDMDFGTILCWGINQLGQQIQPCLFNIYPTGKPEPVFNCTLYNVTSTSVRVSCLSGADNGAPQQFALQVYPNHLEEPQLQPSKLINKESPNFLVKSLTSGTGFSFRINAFNDNGESDIVELKVFTLSVENQKHVSEVREGPIPVEMTSLVWVFLGILSFLVLLLAVAGVIFRVSTVYTRMKRQNVKKPCVSARENATSRTERKEDLNLMIIQNNPDIIPDKDRNSDERRKPRRNSYNTERTSQVEVRTRNGEQRVCLNSMYCTLPKKSTVDRSSYRIIKSSAKMSPSELPMLFQQNSLSIREESSAEDLTQQGREANLRDESGPAPAPPEFADTPPNSSSSLLQIIGEEGMVYDLNTTRF
ncbi:protein turtle homolog A [Eurytemora carolleeae]|uniref:protein turtle homolog A n=1 Tax=Eurytemora carolleeae TaxID=1294199 RepID=UPI000C76C764|nr:protein turtle homolog A [Eurytemora carolleeae]|eukprot:XP_023319737.1 protein turtle homolog A-like [Eurytemora affinis]